MYTNMTFPRLKVFRLDDGLLNDLTKNERIR